MLGTRVAPAPNALSRRVGERTVLLDHSTGEYFTLDPVGGRIWDLLVEDGDLRAVLGRMLQEYDVSEAQLTGDLLRIVADLRAKRLVEVVACP